MTREFRAGDVVRIGNLEFTLEQGLHGTLVPDGNISLTFDPSGCLVFCPGASPILHLIKPADPAVTEWEHVCKISFYEDGVAKEKFFPTNAHLRIVQPDEVVLSDLEFQEIFEQWDWDDVSTVSPKQQFWNILHKRRKARL